MNMSLAEHRQHSKDVNFLLQTVLVIFGGTFAPANILYLMILVNGPFIGRELHTYISFEKYNK
jgi:hypothetical protein